MTKPAGDNYLAQIAAYAGMTSDQLGLVAPGDLTVWLAVVSMLGVSDPTMDTAFNKLFAELSARALRAVIVKAVAPTTIDISDAEVQVVGFVARPIIVPAGSVFRFQVSGILNTDASDSTTTWRIRIGGATLTGSVVGEWAASIGAVARSDAPFSLTADVKIIAIGAAGSAWGIVALTLDDPAQTAKPSIITAPVAVDLSADSVIELTAVSSSPTATWKAVTGTVVHLRP